MQSEIKKIICPMSQSCKAEFCLRTSSLSSPTGLRLSTSLLSCPFSPDPAGSWVCTQAYPAVPSSPSSEMALISAMAIWVSRETLYLTHLFSVFSSPRSLAKLLATELSGSGCILEPAGNGSRLAARKHTACTGTGAHSHLFEHGIV